MDAKDLDNIERRFATLGELEDTAGIDTMVSDIADEVRDDAATLIAEIRRLEALVDKITDDAVDNYLPDTPTDFEANRGLRTFIKWHNQRNADKRIYSLAALSADVEADDLEVITAFIVAEPVSKEPFIDAEGFAWFWEWDGQDIDDEHDPSQWSWVRHRYETAGDAKFMTGPPLFMEWDEVLDYGPLRYAEGDESLGYKIEYFERYENGAPVGEGTVFTREKFAEFMATRKTAAEIR